MFRRFKIKDNIALNWVCKKIYIIFIFTPDSIKMIINLKIEL